MAYQHHHIGGEYFLPSHVERRENAVRVLRKQPAPVPDDISILDDIKSDRFSVNGLSYEWHHYTPNNPKGIIYKIGGRRSKAHSNTALFNFARATNQALIFAEIPNRDENGGYFEEVKTTTEHFLANLPFRQRYKHHTANLIAHSTGAWAMFDALQHDGDNKILPQFNHVAGIGLFLGATYKQHPSARFIYEQMQCRLQKNGNYGDSRFDRWFGAAAMLGGADYFYEPEDTAKETTPTHHGNLYMSNAMENTHRDAMLNTPFPNHVTQSTKISLFHGNRDNIAYIGHAYDLAKKIGCPLFEMDSTYHTPYTKLRLETIFAVMAHEPMPRPPLLPSSSNSRKPFEFARTLALNCLPM